jgi:hypothetical protein
MKAKIVAAIVLAVGAWPVAAQPDNDERPARGVARISLINGDVSVKRGDSGDLTAAAINAPLVVEDRVYTGEGSRVEVQFDYANMVRMAGNGELRLAELEYRRYLLQLAAGTVTFRVLRDSDADVEISTPSVAVRPVKRGEYRVTVRVDGTTEVTVRSGEAEIFTPQGSQRLRAGRTLMARGPVSDPEFQIVNAAREDDWDRWNARRDRDLERSRAYQYVSRDVYGAEDLDAYGRWVQVPPYGWVWSPVVVAGWAPYRLGRWAWIDWYGWTWVSYDPWGWAPYHYGRWFWNAPYGWCWWPGGIGVRHYWRPALVSFFGWDSWSGFHVGVGVGFGRIGWVPLAPFEPYRPWYGSRYYGGFRNRTYVDNSVNIVNNVNITNVYRNARVRDAITVVNGEDFRAGRVGRLRSLSDGELRQASLVNGQLPVAPARESLRLSDREPGRTNVSSGAERFFSRREPSRVERVPFEEQRLGMEQVARRTFEASARGEGRNLEGAVRGVEPGAGRGVPNERGWRSAGEPARVAEQPGVRTGNEAARDGWRRFGEPARTPDGESVGRRGADTNSSRDGWRRFGEPARTPDGESVGRRGADTNSSRDGWRRFGEPARTPDGESVGRRGADTNSSREGWRRFGEPARTPDGESVGRRGADTLGRGDSGTTWRRWSDAPRMEEGARSDDGYGRRGFDGGSRRSESPSRLEFPRGESRQEEPVRVGPRILRERTPGMESGGMGRSSGGFGESRRGAEAWGGSQRLESAPAPPMMRGGGDFGGRSRGGYFGGRVSGGDFGGRIGGGDFGSRGGGGMTRGADGGGGMRSGGEGRGGRVR